jgi:rhodanese-related sulfurtransferase
MWIQNVPLSSIPKGHHIEAGENSMLIQIVDPDMQFPVPSYKFKETHQFQFLDVEEDDQVLEEAMKCSQEQANELVRLLQHALENRMNVVVHCHAGICRSGAVAEVGVMMGFQDTEAFRSPNLLVKHRMMRVLGWTYDEQETHTVNGVTLPSGIIVPPKTVDWNNDNEKVFTLAAARRERRLQTGE